MDNHVHLMDTNLLCRPTDEEVKYLLSQKLAGKRFEELSKSEKYRLLRELKYTTNAGLRQLARIAHIGYNIVRRL